MGCVCERERERECVCVRERESVFKGVGVGKKVSEFMHDQSSAIFAKCTEGPCFETS